MTVETGEGPAIHSLWIGSELRPLEWLCLSSWTRLGYKVVLHAYQEIAAPAGVELFDAARLVPRDKVFFNLRNRSFAVFADLYRALILQGFPAVWLDTDIFLLKPIDFSAPNILAAEFGDAFTDINNAVMKLVPNHPILAEIIHRYQHPWRALPWNRVRKVWQPLVKGVLAGGLQPGHLPWGTLGRLAIHDQIRRQGFDGVVLPSALCLTNAHFPLFQAAHGIEALLAGQTAYIHFFNSQTFENLGQPIQGSVYALLWDLIGADALDRCQSQAA